MSFVKKAVKKVFKVVKKVVKSKIFKIIAIAAIIFFTAGVAAGGFAAFSAAGPGLMGFFTAVGQTMATGAAAMAGGLGLSGTSAALAAHGGAAATAAGLAGAPGILAAGTLAAEGLAAGAAASAAPGAITATSLGEAALAGSTVSGVAVPLASAAPIVNAGAIIPVVSTSAGSSGVGSAISNLMSKKVLGDVSLGQVVTNGVVAGITQVIKGKQKGDEFKNGYVAGGLARGGGTEAPDPYTFEFGGQEAGDPGKQEITTPEQTLAGELATPQDPNQQPGTEPVRGGGILARLNQRGDPTAGLTPGPQAGPPPLNQGLVAPRQQQPVTGGIAGSPFQDRPEDIRGLV